MAAERGGGQDPVGPGVERDGINVPIPGGPGGPNFAEWNAPTWAANVRGAFEGGAGAGGTGNGAGQTGARTETGARRTVRALRRTSSEPPNPNPRYEPQVDPQQQSPSFGRTAEREEDPRPGTRRRFDGERVPTTPEPRGGRTESEPGGQS